MFYLGAEKSQNCPRARITAPKQPYWAPLPWHLCLRMKNAPCDPDILTVEGETYVNRPFHYANFPFIVSVCENAGNGVLFGDILASPFPSTVSFYKACLRALGSYELF